MYDCHQAFDECLLVTAKNCNEKLKDHKVNLLSEVFETSGTIQKKICSHAPMVNLTVQPFSDVYVTVAYGCGQHALKTNSYGCELCYEIISLFFRPSVL
jgi:hypothetical protein